MSYAVQWFDHAKAAKDPRYRGSSGSASALTEEVARAAILKKYPEAEITLIECQGEYTPFDPSVYPKPDRRV
jgi:hypothetical protein